MTTEPTSNDNSEAVSSPTDSPSSDSLPSKKSRKKTWLKALIAVVVALLISIGWFYKVLVGGSMASHLQYVPKEAVSVTVISSLKDLPEPLKNLGILGSDGKPSPMMGAKPPKEGDIDPGSLSFWWESRFNPMQPIVVSHHGAEAQAVHVLHLPTLSPKVSAAYLTKQLRNKMPGIEIEESELAGKPFMVVSGDENFSLASMAILAEEEKLLIAVSAKMSKEQLSSPFLSFLVDDHAVLAEEAKQKNDAKRVRVKAARKALKAAKKPIKKANAQDPRLIKASADLDAAYELPEEDPQSSDAITKAQDALDAIESELAEKVKKDPKVIAAKQALKEARKEKPEPPRVQKANAASIVLKRIAKGVSPIAEEESFAGMLLKLDQPFVVLNHLNTNSPALETFDKNMAFYAKTLPSSMAPGVQIVKNLTDAMSNINTRLIITEQGFEIDGEWEFDAGNYIMKQVAEGGADNFGKTFPGKPLLNLKAALNVDQITKDLLKDMPKLAEPKGVFSKETTLSYGFSLQDDILNQIGAPINLGLFYDESGTNLIQSLNGGLWIKLKRGNNLDALLNEQLAKLDMMSFEKETVNKVVWHLYKESDAPVAIGVVDDHLAILAGSKLISDVQNKSSDAAGFTTDYSAISKRSIEKDSAYALNINPKNISRLIKEKPQNHNGAKEYIEFQRAKEKLASTTLSAFETLSITMPKAGYGLKYNIRIKSIDSMANTLKNVIIPEVKPFTDAQKAYVAHEAATTKKATPAQ